MLLSRLTLPDLLVVDLLLLVATLRRPFELVRPEATEVPRLPLDRDEPTRVPLVLEIPGPLLNLLALLDSVLFITTTLFTYGYLYTRLL